MPVRHEIKSQLAKLLATEDLIVENKKVETAEFNVRTRVLTLPLWDKASNNVYDMLVGHEVGHALYTPDTEWFLERKIPQQFVNIVEDVRIEKLIKRRYAGLSKTFYNAYNELSDNDFFDVQDKDLSELNLADRINLYFKIGNFVDIDFSIEEMIYVNKVDSCETFEEVLNASEALYNYCKQEIEDEKESIAPVEGTGENEGSIEAGDTTIDSEEETSEEVDMDYQPKSADNGPVLEDFEDMTGGNSGGEENIDEELEIQTAKSLDEALKNLVSNTGADSSYFELPEVYLDKLIIPNDFIYNRCQEEWEGMEETYRNHDFYKENPHLIKTKEEIFEEVDSEFFKFKKSAQKEVNYLVKEFEMKKSAGAYARSSVSRTGILDTAKLHTYKYNEDLFKKVSVVPDGKNHGLVFLLDWSGSMHQVMLDTIKQLYNLLWFCKKVQIPFDVYAFTSDFPYGDVNESGERLPTYKRENNKVDLPSWFSLMHLFTNDTKSKQLEDQMKDIFRVVAAMDPNVRTNYNIPQEMRLSGTPLNEAIICLHQILPQFKKKHNLQKVQCVVLSDGEAQPIKINKQVHRPWEEEPFLGTVYTSRNTFLRDRKTGNTYSFDTEWYEQTDVLIQNLKDNLPDMNLIGIRLLSSRDAGQFIRRYSGYGTDLNNKMMSEWKKHKSVAIKNSSYDSWFGLLSSALSSDDEFSVNDDATKVQIKRAFIKSLKNKKMNKKILGEFIELVA